VADAALRGAARAAPGSEAHAVALARAGRWAEAAALYEALVEAAWLKVKDGEWWARICGMTPSGNDPKRPPLTARDLKANRAEWRRLCAARKACR
jgi:dihydrodipicolinate synthase/N-acetylneuraminate lyase